MEQKPRLYIVKDGKVINDAWIAANRMQSPPELFIESPEGKEILYDQDHNRWIRVEEVTTGIVMYDPDAPFPEHPVRSPILHWMAISQCKLPEVKYMGPHPPPTSGPHRYTVLKVHASPGHPDFRLLRFYENRRSNFPLMKLMPELGLKVVASAKFFSSDRK